MSRDGFDVIEVVDVDEVGNSFVCPSRWKEGGVVRSNEGGSDDFAMASVLSRFREISRWLQDDSLNARDGSC